MSSKKKNFDDELSDVSSEEENIVNFATKSKKEKNKKVNIKKKKEKSESSDSEENEESEKNKKIISKKRKREEKEDSNSNSSDKKEKLKKNNKTKKTAHDSNDDEDDNDSGNENEIKPKNNKKDIKKKEESSEEKEEESESDNNKKETKKSKVKSNKKQQSESDSDSEKEVKKEKTKNKKEKLDSDESDSDKEEKKEKIKNKKEESEDDSDSDSEKKIKKGKNKKEKKQNDDEDNEEPKLVKNESNEEEKNKKEKKSFSSGTWPELFVNNLSYNTTDESLKNYFSKYGEVELTKIVYDKETGRPKGVGFCKFSDPSSAAAAIKDNDNLFLDGRPIAVSYSNDKKGSAKVKKSNFKGDRNYQGEKYSIFVGNLSFKSNEDGIKNVFEDCGKIIDIRITRTPEGRSKGFAHVDFDSNEAVENAIEKSGYRLDGRELRIERTSNKPSSNKGVFGEHSYKKNKNKEYKDNKEEMDIEKAKKTGKIINTGSKSQKIENSDDDDDDEE